MIYIKSPEQIEKIRAAGKISAEVMKNALDFCDEGLTLLEIDKFIEDQITKVGAYPWFKDEDNFGYSSCLSVNDVWIHGMPNKYKLKYGDILSIDIGVKKDEAFSDHCWTVPIVEKSLRPKDLTDISKYKGISEDLTHFLEVGAKSLDDAINAAVLGRRTGDISYAMQQEVLKSGFSVVKQYGGHGVGIKPHEDPHIPCYGTKGAGDLLRKGMVLAIEIMYSKGDSEIKTGEDGWSIITKDGSLTGMFEHTVALTEKGYEILTI